MRRIRIAVAAYSAAVVGAEALVLTGSFVLGALLHALLVLALLNHHLALREREGKPADALLALALVPVLRLASLAMAEDDMGRVTRQLVVGVPLLVAAATAATLLRRPTRIAFLRPRSFVSQAALALLGLPLADLALRYADPDAALDDAGRVRLALTAVGFVVLVGYAEELIFRGVLQESLRAVVGPLTIPLATLLFAAVYASVRPLELLAAIVAAGLVFAFLVEWTGSVVGPGIAHGIVAFVLAGGASG